MEPEHMQKLLCLLTSAIFAIGPGVVRAQQAERDFAPVSGWVSGADRTVTVRDDVIQLTSQSGWIRTSRLYSDFVLHLEFRVLEPAAEGCLGIRSWLGFGRSHRGYCVALSDSVDGRWPLGKVMADAAGVDDVAFDRAATASAKRGPGEWQSLEVRTDRAMVIVLLNDVVTSRVSRVDEFTGYLAMHSSRGRIEIRNVGVQRLPASATPFGQNAFGLKDPGVRSPKVVRTAKPMYPAEPHAKWVQGTVGLEAVVLPDGTLGDVRVVQSVHPDLDEAAIACARQWRFQPGSKDGQPAAIVVEMEFSFRRTQ
jgi:TonB family protein